MKKILTLAIIFLLLLSTFSIFAPQVKAETQTTNPFSSTGLYAGSTNPGAVWEYRGGSTWEPISPLIAFDMWEPLGWSVTSIVAYEGTLYASAITDPYIYSSVGRVWRYEGDKRWTLVGELEEQVTFLIVYKGSLYAGTATPARLYRFIPEITAWYMVLEYTPWFGFRSAYVWGDWLYLGEWYWDRFARWDGVQSEPQVFQPELIGSCIYSFEEYRGNLYAGAYVGRVYKVTYEPPTATAIWGPAPYYRYAWSLKEFKGNLYIGFDANGTRTALLYKYDETNPPAQVWSYSTTTTNPYEGIISMATDEAYLYIGVGGQAVGYPSYMSGAGTGYVYKYDGINPPTPISGTLGTGVQTLFYARIQPIQAAQLAKMIIGGPYVSRKGWEYGYFETPEEIKERGLDCSGVVFWAYNRAYFGGKKLTAVEKANRPLYLVYADGQYQTNIIKLTKEKLRLRQGDLLFFDAYSDSKIGKYEKLGQDDHIDHVAMYVGPFSYEGKEYNVVESTVWKMKIIATTVDGIIERITKLAGENAFKGFGRVIDYQRRTEIIGKSSGFSIDLIVIDPEGLVVNKEIPDVLGMYYMEYDIDDDGTIDDIVVISERKIGDYLITVVPEPDALPTDTYTLMIEALIDEEITVVIIAENVQISDIPSQPYTVRSTETEVIPIMPATVDFDPDTLNLKGIDRWVTVYIELPVGHGYDVSQIDVSSVRLNGTVPALAKPTKIGDYDGDGIPDLMVKFDRAAVIALFTGKTVPGNYVMEVTGTVAGIRFKGTDTIRVISPL